MLYLVCIYGHLGSHVRNWIPDMSKLFLIGIIPRCTSPIFTNLLQPKFFSGIKTASLMILLSSHFSDVICLTTATMASFSDLDVSYTLATSRCFSLIFLCVTTQCVPDKRPWNIPFTWYDFRAIEFIFLIIHLLRRLVNRHHNSNSNKNITELNILSAIGLCTSSVVCNFVLPSVQ